MKFTKMHGIGNDYIYINNFEENIDIDNFQEEIIKMSERHKGIGADGVIFIEPSTIADVKMRMFNADGSEGLMCGNGIRCVGKYAYESGISQNKNMSIETKSGVKVLNLEVVDDKVISLQVDMGIPSLNKESIPVIIDTDEVINYPMEILGHTYHFTCVSMGNPHAVIFTTDIDNLKIDDIGPLWENNKIFPKRVNTEFVEVIDSKTLKMRVWERGSGETLACGTGACASVVAAVLNGYIKTGIEVKVILKGGELYITYLDNKHVLMRGSATEVFKGEYKLANVK